MAVWGGLTNGLTNGCLGRPYKLPYKKQRRKGKIYPSECRVPKNSKERKKDFLSGQCKEIEGTDKMEKSGDFFKKIRDTKGTLHAKMNTIKGRHGMDLTEAEDIKRWQEDPE